MDWATMQTLLLGLVYSVFLAASSLALALAGGLVVALARLSVARWLRWPATAYVEFVRGVPLLVLIVWIYFGIPEAVLPLESYQAAILSFGICYSAFIGETYRAGIQSVDRGQAEAARALGMSRAAAFRHVVLPQAVRNILPALGNEGIALVKDTSLASVIAVPELLLRGRTVASANFDYMKIFTVVALLYLATTMVLTRGQRLLERRFGAGTGHLRPGRA